MVGGSGENGDWWPVVVLVYMGSWLVYLTYMVLDILRTTGVMNLFIIFVAVEIARGILYKRNPNCYLCGSGCINLLKGETRWQRNKCVRFLKVAKV